MNPVTGLITTTVPWHRREKLLHSHETRSFVTLDQGGVAGTLSINLKLFCHLQLKQHLCQVLSEPLF